MLSEIIQRKRYTVVSHLHAKAKKKSNSLKQRVEEWGLVVTRRLVKGYKLSILR